MQAAELMPPARMPLQRCPGCRSHKSPHTRRALFHAASSDHGGITTPLCLVCGQPCRATEAELPTASWPPEEVPTKVCRGTPFVTAAGMGSQAWGIHYGV